MKLKIIGFETEIIFDNTFVNILSITNNKCIESDQIFLLNDEDDELDMSKNIILVYDLFNIDYNSKKILNKLYKIISDNVQLKQDLEIEEMSFKIRNHIIEEINELPFEFTMKNELDITEILKLYDLKIDNMCYSNILERVELLIDIISTLKVAKILIIPNLKLFLSDDELLELYKYSLYNSVSLLLIERSNNTKLKYEKILLIDENFDEFIL